MKKPWIFLGLFVVHFLVQFAAWTNADAPHGSHIAWAILSFPTFFLLGGAADEMFWPLMIGNSVLWSAVLVAPIYHFAKPTP